MLPWRKPEDSLKREGFFQSRLQWVRALATVRRSGTAPPETFSMRASLKVLLELLCRRLRRLPGPSGLVDFWHQEVIPQGRLP
jgi:hypothetical protein